MPMNVGEIDKGMFTPWRNVQLFNNVFCDDDRRKTEYIVSVYVELPVRSNDKIERWRNLTEAVRFDSTKGCVSIEARGTAHRPVNSKKLLTRIQHASQKFNRQQVPAHANRHGNSS